MIQQIIAICQLKFVTYSITDSKNTVMEYVTQLLIEYGYQIVNNKKTSKDDPKYLPTKKGLPFSNMSLATGKVGDNTSYQHLKWLESLVDELEELLKV